jgi:hypothetical protein
MLEWLPIHNPLYLSTPSHASPPARLVSSRFTHPHTMNTSVPEGVYPGCYASLERSEPLTIQSFFLNNPNRSSVPVNSDPTGILPGLQSSTPLPDIPVSLFCVTSANEEYRATGSRHSTLLYTVHADIGYDENLIRRFGGEEALGVSSAVLMASQKKKIGSNPYLHSKSGLTFGDILIGAYGVLPGHELSVDTSLEDPVSDLSLSGLMTIACREISPTNVRDHDKFYEEFGSKVIKQPGTIRWTSEDNSERARLATFSVKIVTAIDVDGGSDGGTQV